MAVNSKYKRRHRHMKCPKCGAEVVESKFCHECGASLGAKKIVAHAVNKQAQEAKPEPPKTQEKAAAPQPVKPEAKAAATGTSAVTIKKNNKPMIIAVAVILILIISVAGVATYAGSKAQVEIAEAFENTLFNASSYDFSIENEGLTLMKVDGFVDYGNGLSDSEIYFFLGDEDHQDKGFHFVANKGEVIAGTYGFFAKTSVQGVLNDITELGKMLGLDVTADLAALINSGSESIDALIVNGKINEEAIKFFYNNDVVPHLAGLYGVSKDEVPLYDEGKAIFYDFLQNGLSEDAIKATVAVGKLGEKSYKLTVDIEESATCLYDYIKAKPELAFIANSSLFAEINPEEFYDLGELKIVVGVKDGYLASIDFQQFEVRFNSYNEDKDIQTKHDYVKTIDQGDAWIGAIENGIEFGAEIAGSVFDAIFG